MKLRFSKLSKNLRQSGLEYGVFAPDFITFNLTDLHMESVFRVVVGVAVFLHV